MEKGLLVTMIVITLIFVLGAAPVEGANNHLNEDFTGRNSYQKDTIGNIHIIGNESFQEYAEYLSGNGTEEDPYMLENYIIEDQDAETGIFIQNTDEYFHVRGCDIRGFERGIEIDRVSNFTLENDWIRNVDVGLQVSDSDGNLFRDNNFTENEKLAIELRGDSEGNRLYENELYNSSISLRNLDLRSSQRIAENNTVNGNSIIYIRNSYERDISGEYGELIIANSLGINLNSITLEGGSIGIEILGSSEITINNVAVKNHSLRGVYAGWSDNLTIKDSSFRRNEIGIFMEDVSNSSILKNNISENHRGLSLRDSYGNSIYNNLMKNEVHAQDNGENAWDAGDLEEGGEGGNYWFDYESEDRGDGIGEDPYKIEGGENEDRYPLTAPIGPPTDINARPASANYVNISWEDPYYSIRNPIENITLYRGTEEGNLSEYEKLAGDKSFFKDDNITEEYLFSLNRTEYEEYLQEGTILPELREAFENKSYDVDDEAGLSEENGKWYISQDGLKYIIEIDEEKLNVYREGKEYYYALKASNQKYESVMSEVHKAVPESVRPVIEDYRPRKGEVPVNTTVTVEFSEEMRKGSVNISVLGIEGNITGEGSTFHFVPEGNLSYAEKYSVKVKGKDLAGNRFEKGEFTWEFRTISNGTVRGRVLGVDGEPLAEATIDAGGAPPAFTDEDGQFEIEVPYGNVTLEISKEDYETKQIDVEVQAGEVKSIETITLEKREGIISHALWPITIVGAIVVLLALIAGLVTFRNWGKRPATEEEEIYEEDYEDITEEEFESWWEDEGS